MLLPFAKLAGRPRTCATARFWLWLAGLGPGASVSRAREAPAHRAKASMLGDSRTSPLAWIFAFGTVYFFTAEQGTVWFAAHVVAVALAAAVPSLCARRRATLLAPDSPSRSRSSPGRTSLLVGHLLRARGLAASVGAAASRRPIGARSPRSSSVFAAPDRGRPRDHRLAQPSSLRATLRVRSRAPHRRMASAHRQVGALFVPLPRARTSASSRAACRTSARPTPRLQINTPRPRALVHDADLPLAPLAAPERASCGDRWRSAIAPVILMRSSLPKQRMAPVRLPLLERLRRVLVRDAGDGRLPLRQLVLRVRRLGRRGQHVRRAHVRAQAAASAFTTPTARSRPSSSPIESRAPHVTVVRASMLGARARESDSGTGRVEPFGTVGKREARVCLSGCLEPNALFC